MKDAILYGIYTITPTHYGTGQSVGAVDLPIARESHTHLPFLPSTGLKGVARRAIDLNDKAPERLFGSEANANTQASDGAGGFPKPGSVAFTDARLLFFPVRSLQRAFLYVTCPMALERLERELGAFDVRGVMPAGWRGAALRDDREQVLVSDESLADSPLVLEDVIYNAGEVAHHAGLRELAANLARALIPAEEQLGRSRLETHTALVSDAVFGDLVDRAIPVTARVQLTDGKTTDAWIDEHGNEQKGNLWYEEHLPPDCLFFGFVGEIPGRESGHPPSAMSTYRSGTEGLRRVQIGGNEGIGQGQVWWMHYASPFESETETSR